MKKAEDDDIVQANIEAGNVSSMTTGSSLIRARRRYSVSNRSWIWQADCNGPRVAAKFRIKTASQPRRSADYREFSVKPTSTIRTAHYFPCTFLPRQLRPFCLAPALCIIGHQDYTHRGLDNEQKRQIRPVAQLRWLYGPWRGQPPRQRLLDSESLAAKSCKCLQQPFADNQDRLPRRPKYQSGNPGARAVGRLRHHRWTRLREG